MTWRLILVFVSALSSIFHIFSIQLNTSKLWSLENIQFIIPLQNHTIIKYEEFLSGNSEYKYMTT